MSNNNNIFSNSRFLHTTIILITTVHKGQSYKPSDKYAEIPDLNITFSAHDVSSDNFTSYENNSYFVPNITVDTSPPALFPEWVVWTWTFFLGSLLLAGLGGNALVVAVVARTRDLRSSTNLLLVNLAGADILVLLVPLPTALTELHSRPETWILGKVMCKAVPFVEWTVSHASVLTILVISSERYYAICRPLRASYTCTRIRALTCIVFIWVAALTISLPMLFLSRFAFVRYKGESSLVPTCFTDMSTWWGRGYYTAMVALLFFLPLVLLLVLYLLIGRRLMRDSNSASKALRRKDQPNMKARKQVVVMLATVTAFFFVCLLPFRVFSLWIIWDSESGKTIGPTHYYSLLYASRILLYLNSSINPVLYSLTSSKFREAFIRIIHPELGQALSRNSTLTATANSLSNGRSASSRSSALDPFSTPNGSVRVTQLARYGRQWSLDTLPKVRKNLAHYGRQSSFTTSQLCGWNNGRNCSQDEDKDGKGIFVVKEDNNKFISTFSQHSTSIPAEQRNIIEDPFNITSSSVMSTLFQDGRLLQSVEEDSLSKEHIDKDEDTKDESHNEDKTELDSFIDHTSPV